MPEHLQRLRQQMRDGALNYLAKPIDRAELYRVVDFWLSQDKASDERWT